MHQVEFLFVAGVHDPREINLACADAGIRSVNIDLPGRGCALGNFRQPMGAATEMTRILLYLPGARRWTVLLLVIPAITSTVERMAGCDAFRAQGVALPEGGVSMQRLTSRHGSPRPQAPIWPPVAAVDAEHPVREMASPRGGLLQVTAGPPDLAARQRHRLLQDWDPLLRNLLLDITFVRQDAGGADRRGLSPAGYGRKAAAIRPACPPSGRRNPTVGL